MQVTIHSQSEAPPRTIQSKNGDNIYRGMLSFTVYIGNTKLKYNIKNKYKVKQ